MAPAARFGVNPTADNQSVCRTCNSPQILHVQIDVLTLISLLATEATVLVLPVLLLVVVLVLPLFLCQAGGGEMKLQG